MLKNIILNVKLMKVYYNKIQNWKNRKVTNYIIYYYSLIFTYLKQDL